MITSEFQYKITCCQIENFKKSIADAKARSTTVASGYFNRLEVQGLESQLATLEKEVHDYETTRKDSKKSIMG